MVVVPFLRPRGGFLLGLLTLGVTTLALQNPAFAQFKPFPVTTPRTGSQLSKTATHRSSYGTLPLSFEQNRGQAGADVSFLAHGQGYNLALTSTEARFTLRGRKDHKRSPEAAYDVLRMQLVGAATSAPSVGRSALPGKVNYLHGRDPAQWRTNIPTYREVSYRGVYPGVDLIYYGNQRQLEYDFVVAPKADPSKITLGFAGAKTIAVDKSGALVVGLKTGSVRWRKPSVYQTVNGQRKPVASRFVLKRGGRVGFALARYDFHRPLVIDPVLIYSTYLGGSGVDNAYAIAVDKSGNAYIGGTTTSPDFPGAGSGFTSTSDAFIAKLNSTGTGLVYATYLGGAGDTNCWSLALDSAGGVYACGDTTAANFPTMRAFSSTFSGARDAYVTRINPAGTAIVYSTFLGGSSSGTAQGITLGPNGQAYVTGYTDSADFPTVGAVQSIIGGGQDAFVARFDTAINGTGSLVYSSYLGGIGDDRAFGIAVDSASRIYITGDTTSGDFPVVSGFQAALLSFQNAFVATLSANGASIDYSTFLGGNGTDSGFAIAVDGSRHAYITGATSSTDFPKRSPFQSVIGGADDAFISKIDTAAAGDPSLIYSTYLGGSSNDAGRSIAIDVWGNAYVAGDTDSNFSPFNGSDPFVVKLGINGSKLLYGTLIGGSGFEANLGIALDPSGNAYITGYTNSVDYPITQGAFQANLAGSLNAFVAKIPTYAKFDVNNDGQSDILFQNTNTGQMVYWIMNGDRETRYGFLSPVSVSPNWKVAATAELNGDNYTDLIFQDRNTGDLAFWLLNGPTQTAVANLTPKNPGTGWQVVGSGDFNQDGYTDILFQNSTSGDLFVWNMQGTAMVSGNFISPANPGSGWKVAAVGDLNGDGQPDILFQNATSGNLYVWYLHGPTLFQGGFLNPANPGANWNAAGLADLNGDGQPEILFQNANSGQLAYWAMSGSNLLFVGFPRPSNPGGNVWRLAGPH